MTNPALGKNLGQLNDKWRELNRMFDSFARDLDKKCQEIKTLNEEGLEVLGKQQRWWESTNIFSEGMR